MTETPGHCDREGTHCRIAPDGVLLCDVQPTELGVRRAMQGLMGHLGGACDDDAWRARVEIAVTESLNNIVEHAFADGGMPMARRLIRIRCDTALDVIRVEIEDNGCPLPGGKLPAGLAADLDVPVEDLPEGGFGWFLIRSLANTICYCRTSGWNQLKMVFEEHPTAPNQ